MIRQDWSTLKKLMFAKTAAGGKAVEDTATGNPLTFLTDLAKPLKSLVANFLPVQTGSGDPAPDNDRPIVPWNGLTVWNGGKNLYDEATYPLTQGRLIWPGDGTSDANADYAATIDFVPCENIAGKKITLNKRPGGGNPGFCFYSSASAGGRISGLYNSGITAGTPWTITVPEGAKYMRFTVPAGATDIQLEAGNTATAYEPYKPITETDISFPSPVYGGTPDVVSGKLTVTMVARVFDGSSDEQWGGSSGTRQVFPIQWAEVRGARLDGKRVIACNMLKPSIELGDSPPFGYIYNTQSEYNIRTHLVNEDITQEQFRALLAENPLVVVCPLVTPVEIQLTPQQITAIKGNNTIWSDANGEMTAIYLKKG